MADEVVQTQVTNELIPPPNGSPMVPATETPPATQTPPANEPPVKKEVFFAGRKFDSEADALAYASALAPQATTPPPQSEQDIDPAQIMFEDPATYTRLVKEQAKKELRDEYTAEQSRQETWRKFYEKHQDLKGHEELVKGILATRPPEFAKLPLDQGLEALAKETRATMAKIKGTNGQAERLNPNGAQTASPSAAPGVTTVVHTTKPTTFVDEMKAIRAKRQKVV